MNTVTVFVADSSDFDASTYIEWVGVWTEIFGLMLTVAIIIAGIVLYLGYKNFQDFKKDFKKEIIEIATDTAQKAQKKIDELVNTEGKYTSSESIKSSTRGEKTKSDENIDSKNIK